MNYPSLHPFGVVHWVPEQLNIKVVTGHARLQPKELCLPHFQWHQLAYATDTGSDWLAKPAREIQSDRPTLSSKTPTYHDILVVVQQSLWAPTVCTEKFDLLLKTSESTQFDKYSAGRIGFAINLNDLAKFGFEKIFRDGGAHTQHIRVRFF